MNLYEKLRKKYYGHAYEAANLTAMMTEAQPARGDFEVCFYAPPPQYFNRGGKMNAMEYLPTFCDQLRTKGTPTHLVSRKPDLAKFVGKSVPTVLVCIYQEEGGHIPTDPEVLALIDKADLVFNHPRPALTIVNKLATSKALAKAGCNVPQLAQNLDKKAQVFSNAMDATAEESFMTTAENADDDDRFNAEFIDTRMSYDGRDYYTTMRLMCINDQITHMFMRARDAGEENPNTHAKNTPLDPDLINHLWQEQVSKYGEQFQTIARQVYETFGDGFYAHDTLVDQASATAYICETGWKFNDMAYARRVADFKNEVLGIKGYTSPQENAANAAPVFWEEVREHFGLN